MKNSYKIKLLQLFVLVGYSFVTQAQNPISWCGSDQEKSDFLLKNPEQLKRDSTLKVQMRAYIDANKSGQNKSNGTHYTIPVVFHCIETSTGLGYVSDSIIEASLNELNVRFNRQNADTIETRNVFLPYADYLDIEFKLAHIDPYGNCTSGIERYVSDVPMNSSAAQNFDYWDPLMYFNVYVAESVDNQVSGILGFYSPGSSLIAISSEGLLYEGVLTHEFGHAFGLNHVFDIINGCGGACDVTGDYICDTPPSFQTWPCDTLLNSCSNDTMGPSPYLTDVVDQIENYMSYNIGCQNMFTAEQVLAMEFRLEDITQTHSHKLSHLHAASNLLATGVDLIFNPDNCIYSDFVINMGSGPYLSDTNYFCQGETVLFFDNTQEYGVPTSWNWTFQGGLPSISSDQNPQIQYNTLGTYEVTLDASNPLSTGTSASTVITINSITPEINNDYRDEFESPSLFPGSWKVKNVYNNNLSWSHCLVAGASSNGSIRVRSYFHNGNGVHSLISPSFDFSQVSQKKLSFDFASEFKTTTTGEVPNISKLKVFYSLTCGQTWEPVLELSSSLPLGDVNSLNTTNSVSGNFIPDNNDWKEKTIDLTSIGQETNVLFRFDYELRKPASNFYLDNINFGDSTIAELAGVTELPNFADVVVYPNPSSSGTKVSFYLPNDVKNLRIVVRDVLSKEVTTVVKDFAFNAGHYTLTIDEEQQLKSGIYFLEFSGNGNSHVEKFIIR